MNNQKRKDETYDMKTNQQSTIFAHPYIMALLATICCLLWGSAFPSIKLGYRWFDISAEATSTQILFAGCRFTLAGILTVAIGSILAKKVLIPKRESLGKIAILSIFQTSLHYFCFYVGLAHTTGVKSSILNGISVFVAILIAALVFKQEKLTAVKLLGSILGFSGIVLVNLTGAGLDVSFQMQGEGMIILSTVCYGISSALIRVYGKDENPVVLSGYQFTLGGVVMIVIGYLTGGRLDVWTGKGIAIIIYLALVSAIAYTVWSLLLRYNDVSKVAVFGCLNPVFGAILSALILKESGQSFGLKEVIALVLITVGIFIVQKKATAKS